MRALAGMLVQALLLGATLAACDTDKVTKDKELKQEQDKNQQTTDQNVSLKNKNDAYKRYLDNMYVTDHSLWFFADIVTTNDGAAAVCTDVGYALPKDADLDEFFAQVVAKHPEWTSGKSGSIFVRANIHVDPPKAGLTPEVVMCRKDRPS